MNTIERNGTGTNGTTNGGGNGAASGTQGGVANGVVATRAGAGVGGGAGGGRRGFSLRVFMAEGTADGLALVDHSQWIGRCMIVPRASYRAHARRRELSDMGVYVLTGPNPKTACERVFVSQTAKLRDEIDAIANKDFWTSMIVLTAEGPRLHRAHTDYIETRLVQIARGCAAAEVDNENGHSLPQLFEADAADAEHFVEQIVLMMPTLGVRAFEATPSAEPGTKLRRLSSKGAVGTGYKAGGRFVVQAGSTAARQDGADLPGYVSDLRRSLLSRGVLADENNKLYRFARDFAFDTPALAGMLVAGESVQADAWNQSVNQTVGQSGAGGSPASGSAMSDADGPAGREASGEGPSGVQTRSLKPGRQAEAAAD